MNLDEIEELIRRYLSAGIAVVIILVSPGAELGGTAPDSDPSVVTLEPSTSASPTTDAPVTGSGEPDDPDPDESDLPTIAGPTDEDTAAPTDQDAAPSTTGAAPAPSDDQPSELWPGDDATGGGTDDDTDATDPGSVDEPDGSTDESTDGPDDSTGSDDGTDEADGSTDDVTDGVTDADVTDEDVTDGDVTDEDSEEGDDSDLDARGPADSSEAGIDAAGTGSTDMSPDTSTDEATAPTGTADDAAADGTAAGRYGWGTPTREDDFTAGTDGWEPYTGPGFDGQGQRSPQAVTVENGMLVISGDPAGTTGGVSWGTGQRYGRWEGRVRAPAADPSYDALLLLWPDAEDFPTGGEIDFMEMGDPDRQRVQAFLHHGDDNEQVTGEVAIDGTQWHNWAVEWTPEAITTYVDGEQWFRTTDTATFPPGPMHLCIQLDWFPEGTGAVQESRMEVDWVRQYALDDPATTAPASAPDADADPFGSTVRRMFSWG